MYLSYIYIDIDEGVFYFHTKNHLSLNLKSFYLACSEKNIGWRVAHNFSYIQTNNSKIKDSISRDKESAKH